MPVTTPKPTALAVLALLWGAGARLEAAPAADNPFQLKPGARSAACLGCHEDFADKLKQPFVHKPVKGGSCTDCHNPHASSHGKLLGADPERVCVRCHEEVLPADAGSVHQAVAQGHCVKCHDPHGSKNRNNLLSTGNELCLGCHGELGQAIAAASFRHPPVARNCLQCHTPHASRERHLLRKSAPGLCTDCHRTDQPAFLSQHLNYPVGKADCNSCHDPHGSSTRGMMWANVHEPVRNKTCGQCHQPAASRDALAVKQPGLGLCEGCHKSVVEAALARNRLHWPVVAGQACITCHDPHAARHKPLLQSSQIKVCGGCHADTIARQASSLTKHPPVESGECTACHVPHASDGVLLLRDADANELCGTCHDWRQHSNHPIGKDVVDPRNKNLRVDCLSCHRNHGSPYKHFAHQDTGADLCVQCHQQYTR